MKNLIKGKIKKLEAEFKAYRFRNGQYFDRVLYKLLDKYGLTLDEFYEGRK